MKARCLFRRPDFFFVKYVVFKVGIHGHLSVSHIGDYRPYLGRMVYSDEDVPSKFAVHLVNIGCRGWEGGGGVDAE